MNKMNNGEIIEIAAGDVQADAGVGAGCSALLTVDRLNDLLLRHCEFLAVSGGHTERTIVMVGYENGKDTHLALEVMEKGGHWSPLLIVPMRACRAPLSRPGLRQFPLFRLAWYGQLEDPSIAPHAGDDAQVRRPL